MTSRLTLVGVIAPITALYSADFRATRRLAALLFQVAGRAGRSLPERSSCRPRSPAHALPPLAADD
jgi:primosomal protein N' (replication factor Y)